MREIQIVKHCMKWLAWILQNCPVSKQQVNCSRLNETKFRIIDWVLDFKKISAKNNIGATSQIWILLKLYQWSIFFTVTMLLWYKEERCLFSRETHPKVFRIDIMIYAPYFWIKVMCRKGRKTHVTKC